jgi:hypothetical protein
VRLRARDGSALDHKPLGQGMDGSGFFANLLVGWAFDV